MKLKELLKTIDKTTPVKIIYKIDDVTCSIAPPTYVIAMQGKKPADVLRKIEREGRDNDEVTSISTDSAEIYVPEIVITIEV